jgi:cell division septal protein FtsQ
MSRKVRRPYILMIIFAVLIAGGIGFLRYSNVFAFQNVTFASDNKSIDTDMMQLPVGANLFNLPLKSAAEQLLSRKNIYKVDLGYHLPDGIVVKINDIRPIAMVIGPDGSSRYRLGENGCLLPIDSSIVHYDFPIITGLNHCTPYGTCNDDRLKLIVRQLSEMKKDFPDFYLALSNIDMSDSNYISIWLDGLAFRVDTYAGSLYETVQKLKTFILEFNPDLQNIKKLDMRSEGLIIAAD